VMLVKTASSPGIARKCKLIEQKKVVSALLRHPTKGFAKSSARCGRRGLWPPR
jgi:hypothetical protein